jgi:hypothetical protein
MFPKQNTALKRRVATSRHGARVQSTSESSKSVTPHPTLSVASYILRIPLRLLDGLVFVARVPLVAAMGNGDDFSNNLFSDLAPILALFGEQVAKQFMAGSTTWEDNIIFAMVEAPVRLLL